MFSKITPQILLRKVKRALGAKSLKLSYSDQEIMDIFYEETLPIFSIYFPANYSLKVDLNQCKKSSIPTARDTLVSYKLDLPYGLDVIDIEDINVYTNRAIMNNYQPGTYGFMDAYDIFNNEILQGMMDSMVYTEPIWEFKEPNILIIENTGYYTSSGVVILELCVVHAKDLSTLKYSYLEYITELFTLDCKRILYEDMKHSDKINSQFATFDLKIDDWVNAKDKREELLEKWDREFLIHRRKTIHRG